jgi:YfiH family protein
MLPCALTPCCMVWKTSELITPCWPAPPGVKAVCSTREGGYSVQPYHSLNLGAHVGDNPESVKHNRLQFQHMGTMPSQPVWLEQVHGTRCLTLTHNTFAGVQADASYSRQPGVVCSVMTADCLPLLLCNRAGTEVAAVHAGWRGLCNGIIENTLQLFSQPSDCIAWLGPAISQQAFEVGPEVRDAFIKHAPVAKSAFIAGQKGKWLADLYMLARQRLNHCGVNAIFGGEFCTYQQSETFFSYRRDGQTGRMACAIWRQ